MKSLIVEDSFVARKLMQVYLSELGDCHIAVNGLEAVEAVKESLQENYPYDLICLDVMMPEMDGIEALKHIRKLESDHGLQGLSGTKIIMTTAKDQSKDIFAAFNSGCEAYLIKPIRKNDLFDEIEKLGLATNC